MPAGARGQRLRFIMGAMTLPLFRQDAYRRECSATVLAITPDGLVLDQTVFYPLGGGQAGDAGVLVLANGQEVAVTDTRKAKDAEGVATEAIWHVLALPETLPEYLSEGLQVGAVVTARIDWARRHKLMRFHTATHLLCHLVPQLVNGCSITPDYARLDFNMSEALDKETLNAGLARLVAAAVPVQVGAISDNELDANPSLVKSMSVQPPRGSGSVRTVRIDMGPSTEPGPDDAGLIDFQPCGGTHVGNTAEIGAVLVTKIEKKGAMLRRVVLGFAA